MAQVLATTLVVASLYALLAAGYVLVYRASRVLNLAQGDMLTLGGYLLFAVAANVGGGPVLAIPAAAALAALTGFLIYLVLMRPMAGHPVFAAVLVTVTLGILMRAAGERALLASQRGIDFHRLFALAWALAALSGALAGILYSSNVRLEPSLDVLGLKAFAVALVGGLDSLGGVIPAAILVALIEVLTVRYGNPLLSDVSPFLCLLAMLLVRPWGLFGTKEELERV